MNTLRQNFADYGGDIQAPLPTPYNEIFNTNSHKYHYKFVEVET